MTIAFTFWQLPEEEEEFLDFLDTTGVIVSYPDHWVRTGEEATAQPLRRYLIEDNPRQCLLGLDSGRDAVVVGAKQRGDEKFLSVDLTISCLIAYSRPRFRVGTQLGQSNLAAYLRCSDTEDKPDWFQAWVKQVFGWAKKRARKKCRHQGSDYPATSLVLSGVEQGRIEPVF